MASTLQQKYDGGVDVYSGLDDNDRTRRKYGTCVKRRLHGGERSDCRVDNERRAKRKTCTIPSAI
jgi:hypothetical protein